MQTYVFSSGQNALERLTPSASQERVQDLKKVVATGTCPSCGSVDNAVLVIASYWFNSIMFGEGWISDVEHYACRCCSTSVLVTPSGASRISEYLKSKVLQSLGSKPIHDFVPKKEALALLRKYSAHNGIGVDYYAALHHILKLRFAGIWVYYKPSVEAYARCGNGNVKLA